MPKVKVANSQFTPVAPSGSAKTIHRFTRQTSHTYHALVLSLAAVMQTEAIATPRKLKAGLTAQEGYELAGVIAANLHLSAQSAGVVLPEFKTVVVCAPFTRTGALETDQEALADNFCRLAEQSVSGLESFYAITKKDPRLDGVAPVVIESDLEASDGFTEFAFAVMLVTSQQYIDDLADKLNIVFEDSPSFDMESAAPLLENAFKLQTPIIAVALADWYELRPSDCLRGMHFSALAHMAGLLIRKEKSFVIYFDSTAVSYRKELGLRIAFPNAAVISVENPTFTEEELAIYHEELLDEYQTVRAVLQELDLKFTYVKQISHSGSQATSQYLWETAGIDANAIAETRYEAGEAGEAQYAVATIHRNTIDDTPALMVLAAFDKYAQCLATKWVYFTETIEAGAIATLAKDLVNAWELGPTHLDINEVGLSYGAKSRVPEVLDTTFDLSLSSEARVLH